MAVGTARGVMATCRVFGDRNVITSALKVYSNLVIGQNQFVYLGGGRLMPGGWGVFKLQKKLIGVAQFSKVTRNRGGHFDLLGWPIFQKTL